MLELYDFAGQFAWRGPWVASDDGPQASEKAFRRGRASSMGAEASGRQVTASVIE